MRRHGLRDDQWEWVEDLLPGWEGQVGGTAKDDRLFVETVPYRYRTGIPYQSARIRQGSLQDTSISSKISSASSGSSEPSLPTATKPQGTFSPQLTLPPPSYDLVDDTP
ncbi:MAG: transposase [Rhodospirillaceae bacterium]|nr:MAG: transposase [Rhodospirillaceae bacterium]